jgi:hypothetical protein
MNYDNGELPNLHNCCSLVSVKRTGCMSETKNIEKVLIRTFKGRDRLGDM